MEKTGFKHDDQYEIGTLLFKGNSVSSPRHRGPGDSDRFYSVMRKVYLACGCIGGTGIVYLAVMRSPLGAAGMVAAIAAAYIGRGLCQ